MSPLLFYYYFFCRLQPEKTSQLIATEVYGVEVGEVLQIVIRDGAALQLILTQQQNLFLAVF